MKKVAIDHFSDVLCVWAYAAQIRLDELKREFRDQITLNYHFIPIFGTVESKIAHGWRDRGGYEGFGQHVLDVCQAFPHLEISTDVWKNARPKSSASPHLFLKAVELATLNNPTDDDGCTPLERTAWRLRQAFFRDNINIAMLDEQLALADALDLPTADILSALNNGSAMAALCQDAQLCKDYAIGGSPTYVLSEGRQKLYGNVGYKVIAANVQELLHQPQNQASWC